MRAVGILALAFFFPVFACAADLVNINTADATTLDTLPHVGPALAQKIIDYRTQHGSYARIEDLQNVSGIGSGSNYADIAPLITVGSANTSPPADTTATTTESAPNVSTTSPPSSAPPEYLPIPTLEILTNTTRVVSSSAETAFTAVVYDSKGNKRDDAIVTWSFGDGMRKTGASVFHQYYASGEYLAVVRATTTDGGNVQKEVTVTVQDASIKIVSISSRGITLANNDSHTLDLSFWKLSMGGREFKIPEDTQILAGHTILFPLQVIELPVADIAALLYPSGEVAATYGVSVVATHTNAVQPAVQLSSNTVSYEQVQKVEPIISQAENVPAHEEAVSAPAAATKLAAAGAALPLTGTTIATPASGIFKSPWTLGFLGTVLLAGSAFIFL
ncbi:MAG: helix-hairpin-helix domain-containing protein [Candidatus Pacebacteria bacterium]|nr:helix-hairpin-helix domain-containing protein [Candidatus Paceibacterota bacterium]